ncbi:hypothetical protein ASPBRDRAFT_175357 [Aspergillus brasiliensis CBS 101740]|uniref:Uncharacterized protein n=1 Tax=Aspergillus brasiliensis (strain CBS 101740 / IMI 381727 / IBT 21946) TaxID=767769 RepID=A0A1L9UL10_ASPBC|nr:hypothetical protein ASPBRDRAFT_175357 [Aspergillus brasiliensis CBS 101740]
MYKLCAQHSASCTPPLLSLNLITKDPENIPTDWNRTAARPFRSILVKNLHLKNTVMSEMFSCISSTGQGRRMEIQETDAFIPRPTLYSTTTVTHQMV